MPEPGKLEEENWGGESRLGVVVAVNSQDFIICPTAPMKKDSVV